MVLRWTPQNDCSRFRCWINGTNSSTCHGHGQQGKPKESLFPPWIVTRFMAACPSVTGACTGFAIAATDDTCSSQCNVMVATRTSGRIIVGFLISSSLDWLWFLCDGCLTWLLAEKCRYFVARHSYLSASKVALHVVKSSTRYPDHNVINLSLEQVWDHRGHMHV